MTASDQPTPAGGGLAGLAGLFARLGVLGFGGPAAHIAMMRHEIVERREWMDDREFLRMAAATNLIPGPNSTELAMHIGARRAGGRGLLVAGLCFILPAVGIVAVLAGAYEHFGARPEIVDVRLGVLPVIIAIVVHSAFGLARSTTTDATSTAITLGAAAGYLGGVHELLVLAGAGALACIIGSVRRHRLEFPAVMLVVAMSRPSLVRIGLIFLEVGATLYGSGYVLLAYLDSRLVGTGLLERIQLLDAVSVGQITPGPVFSTATFVGWQLSGPLGATVATVAIFTPAFLFVALLGPITSWLDRHSAGRDVLDGLAAASLGMMVAVVVPMAEASLVDPLAAATATAALAGLALGRVSTTRVVAAGVAIGVARLIL